MKRWLGSSAGLMLEWTKPKKGHTNPAISSAAHFLTAWFNFKLLDLFFLITPSVTMLIR